MFVVYFVYIFFFCYIHVLTFNVILIGVMSFNLSFIFDPPIISKTNKYINQSDKTIIGVYSVLIPKDLVGSPGESMNLDMSPYEDVARGYR